MSKKLIALILTIALLAAFTPLAMAEGESEYPAELTVFTDLSEHLSALGLSSNGEHEVYAEIERLTGTKINWIHPAAGSDYVMQFNLLVTANQLPDIVIWEGAKKITGGLSMWEQDGIFIDLTELMPVYAPNYLNRLESFGETAVNQTIVDGKMYYVADFSEISVWRGMFLRSDWLDALGLSMPTTPDELYDVLVAFRDKDPNGNGEKDEWPLSCQWFAGGHGLGMLLWAWGVFPGFMQIDGQVTYGPLLPEFADGMEYIAKLYAEGLVDPDYDSNNADTFSGKFMNDQVGVGFYAQPTKILNGVAGKPFEIKGIPHLSAIEGQKGYVFWNEYIESVTSYCDALITTACKEPEKALKWLDFFFTDEGVKLTNFGIEGKSYRIDENGETIIDFTEALAKYPDIAEGDIKRLYTMQGLSSFPTLNLVYSYRANLHPQAVDAILAWESSADLTRILPSVSLTAEESELINDTMVDINTFMNIEYAKLVNGQTALSEIPNIQQKLIDMGIEDAIEAYQAAYDRFMGK